MSINITPEIEAAYKAHLDEQVDADFMGKTIRRRDTYPYIAFSGLVIFAAGFQAARTAPTSAAGATKPDELTSSPEPAPSRASGLLPVAREGLSDETKALYDELLLAVHRKFPDESRHETALRYIRGAEWEAQQSGRAAAALPSPASGDAPGEAK